MLPSADKYTNACYQPKVLLQIVPDEKIVDIARCKQQKNMRNTDYVKSSEPIEKTMSSDVIVSRSGRKIKPALKYLDEIGTEVLKRSKQSKEVNKKRRKVSKITTSTESIEISKCDKISAEEKTISILNGRNLNASSSDIPNKNDGNVFTVSKHSKQNMTMTIKRLKKDFKTCVPSGVVKSNKKHVKNNTKVSKCSMKSSTKKSKKDPDISIAKEFVQFQPNDITTEISNLEDKSDVVSKIMTNKGVPSGVVKSNKKHVKNNTKVSKCSMKSSIKKSKKKPDISIAKKLVQFQSNDITTKIISNLEDKSVVVSKIMTNKGILCSSGSGVKQKANYGNDKKVSKHSKSCIIKPKQNPDIYKTKYVEFKSSDVVKEAVSSMKISNDMCSEDIPKALPESQFIDITNKAMTNVEVNSTTISNKISSRGIPSNSDKEQTDEFIHKLKNKVSNICISKALPKSQFIDINIAKTNVEVNSTTISNEISSQGIPSSSSVKLNANHENNDKEVSKHSKNILETLNKEMDSSDVCIPKELVESQYVTICNSDVYSEGITTDPKSTINCEDNDKKLKPSTNYIHKLQKKALDICIAKVLDESQSIDLINKDMENIEVTPPIISNGGISFEGISPSPDTKPNINYENNDIKKSKHYIHKLKNKDMDICIAKKLDESQSADITNEAMSNLEVSRPLISHGNPYGTDSKPNMKYLDYDKKKSKHSKNFNDSLKGLKICIPKELIKPQILHIVSEAKANVEVNLSMSNNISSEGISPSPDTKPNINYEDNDIKKPKCSIHKLENKDMDICIAKKLDESQYIYLTNEVMENPVVLPIISNDIPPITDGKPNINDEDNNNKELKRSRNSINRLKKYGSDISITEPLVESQSADFSNEALSNLEGSNCGLSPEEVSSSSGTNSNKNYLGIDEKTTNYIHKLKKKHESQSADFANKALSNPEVSVPIVSKCGLSPEGLRLSIEKLEFYKAELEILTNITELRNSLQIDKTDLPVAINALENMNKSKIDAITLKKYPSIVDIIQKVSMYVGVIDTDNCYMKRLERHILNEQRKMGEIIRKLAIQLLFKFKSLFTIPDEQTFQEVFNNAIRKFAYKVRHMTNNEIYELWTDTYENDE